MARGPRMEEEKMLRSLRRIAAVTAPVLAIAGASLGAAQAAIAGPAAVKPYTVTAYTNITARPDSGAHGNNWALDSVTRVASVHLASEVALSYCGGKTQTGHCYHWTGHITDQGTFTTIAGATVPGFGDLNGGGAPKLDVAVKGAMAGTYRYDFYSSWKTASSKLVPTKENDGGNTPGGRSTTGAWVEQFFGGGAKFFVNGAASDSLGTTGSWSYMTAFGDDSACPNSASQWVDGNVKQAGSAGDWGASALDGNILAPSAANC